MGIVLLYICCIKSRRFSGTYKPFSTSLFNVLTRLIIQNKGRKTTHHFCFIVAHQYDMFGRIEMDEWNLFAGLP